MPDYIINSQGCCYWQNGISTKKGLSNFKYLLKPKEKCCHFTALKVELSVQDSAAFYWEMI